MEEIISDAAINYSEIVEQLRRLREAHTLPAIFGAELHRFQIHPTLNEKEIHDFEDKHGVQLPSDYRGFLINVGDGGAGPAYGVFKLGEMDSAFEGKRWKENDAFVGNLSSPFPHRSAWNDHSRKHVFDPLKETEESEDEYERQMDLWDENYWNPANLNGAIPICHLGCALHQWLVIAGPEYGNIWDDGRASYGGLAPHQQNGRHRVTFGQWYTDWINDALSKL